jgi:hypothetical protein
MGMTQHAQYLLKLRLRDATAGFLDRFREERRRWKHAWDEPVWLRIDAPGHPDHGKNFCRIDDGTQIVEAWPHGPDLPLEIILKGSISGTHAYIDGLLTWRIEGARFIPAREGVLPAIADLPADSEVPPPWDTDARRELNGRLDAFEKELNIDFGDEKVTGDDVAAQLLAACERGKLDVPAEVSEFITAFEQEIHSTTAGATNV